MKTLQSSLLLLALLCTILSTQSCKNECDDLLCQNGGICVDGSCDCPDGFSGTNCQIQDLCFGITCFNGGICLDGSCDCPDGYTGINCETQDLCFGISCENDGVCIDGTCDCPDGYFGTNCEWVDPTQIQALLYSGKRPIDLYNSGISLEQLYGKTYEGGLIFYLNLLDGTGMVAATEDQSTEAEWGCYQIDFPGAWGVGIGSGAQNTIDILNGCSESGIAARICGELILNNKNDWFLPSMEELELMRINLHNRGHGGFTNNLYWSSRQNNNYGGAKAKDFEYGINWTLNKFSLEHVRAVREF